MKLLFAWRYFKAKKSANAINIIAWVTVSVIAVATSCQILVLSVFNGFEGLVQSLYSSFYTDLRVIPTKGKTFLYTQEQRNRIIETPFIDAVSGVIEEKAVLENADLQTIIDLKGVDSEYIYVTGVAHKIISGTFDLGDKEIPRVVLGSGVQSAIGANTDDKIDNPSVLTIILPQERKDGGSNPLESISEGNARASGTFSIQQEFDSKYAITNIDFMRQQIHLQPDECSALEIKVAPSADLTAVQQSLSKILGSEYIVQTKYEQNNSLYHTMKLEKWFIYAVLTLILMIAAFNMTSSLQMLVLEKQKDILLLQSMGAHRTLIVRIFLMEGLLLGSIGAFTGIIIATLICLAQVKFKLLKLQGASFLIDYYPVQLELSDFLMVIVTIGIITFCASWLPAKKAAHTIVLI